jgi:hypothetical protein
MKLLNVNGSNTKIAKTIKRGENIRVASLSLMPDRKICAGSKAAGCFETCLKSSGRGAFKNVATARQNKTDFYLSDRPGFLAQLRAELTNFDKLCTKQKVKGWVRLNTISDIDYENHGIPQAFPALNFYDYTKRVDRLGRTPSNYQLIFSYSGRKQYQKSVDKRPRHVPMAVVFRNELPQYWNGQLVIDGDLSDIVNVKAGGVIVGLRAKGKAKRDRSGFVVESNLIATD